MGLLQEELQEVKKLCEHLINKSRLVSCVETMVRVEIKRTNFKTVIICMQFPSEYPDKPLLLELKSKTLDSKLLDGLTNVSELELKKNLGKPQIMKTLKFIETFLVENPLCCCYNEINNMKKQLSTSDELKLRQKSSSIFLKIPNNLYYLETKIIIPEDYPENCVRLEELETNLPPYFKRFIIAQSKEYARQCVEPPLCRKPNEPPFKVKPSLERVALFLIDAIKRFPTELCQFCKLRCFPENPKDVVTDERLSKCVDRLYCGHILHSGCLIDYMRKPPFGNKKCSVCNARIFHEKWGISDKLAEDRWSHEQARERELAEVADFLQ